MEKKIGGDRVFGRELFLDHNDFDANQNWKPSSWLGLFQQLGTEQCERLGYGDLWLEERGVFWALIRIRVAIDEARPATGAIYGETWRQGNVGALWRREYLLSTSCGKRLGAATALWALVNRQTRALLRPHAFPDDFPTLSERLALPDAPQKLAVKDLPFLEQRIVRYSDLDANGHTNNSRYAEWLCDTYFEHEGTEMVPTGLQIDFRREVRLGNPVRLYGAYATKEKCEEENSSLKLDRTWEMAAYHDSNLSFVAALHLQNEAEI